MIMPLTVSDEFSHIKRNCIKVVGFDVYRWRSYHNLNNQVVYMNIRICFYGDVHYVYAIHIAAIVSGSVYVLNTNW